MIWKDILVGEVEKPYFKDLVQNVKKAGVFYPNKNDMFRAFELTKFEDIKIVILGQDPYHGDNQANGLAFSVNSNQPLPPSLRNIFKEIKNDTGVDNSTGDLSCWSKRGVFLLNSILTVSPNQPGSHVNFGWEKFTDKVVSEISQNLNNVVFMFWGAYAKSKVSLIDATRHHILCSSHPSPLSAHTGFFGCKHFSSANNYLTSVGRNCVDWSTE